MKFCLLLCLVALCQASNSSSPSRHATRLTNLEKKMSTIAGDLHKTKDELDSTKSDLHQTKHDLDSTKSDLHKTKDELDSTKSDLASTKRDLASTKSDQKQNRVSVQTNIVAESCHCRCSFSTI